MKSSIMKAAVASLAVSTVVLATAVSCGSGSGSDSDKQDGSAQMIITGRTPLPGAKELTPRTGNFASLCKRSEEKQFSAPTTVIDPTSDYVATITTEKGDIRIQLNPQAAPVTVNSFVFLACSGFYEGVTFHRVITGFVAQGGDPTGTGTGSPGYTIPDEFNDIPFSEGTLAMAKTSAANSGGSQFFICYQFDETTEASLHGKYTIFGKVTGGMDVVKALTPRDPADNGPPGDKILAITVQEY